MLKLNVNIEIKDELIEKIVERLNQKSIDLESYILELVQNDINAKISFDKSFSFDYISKKLYVNDKEIHLKPYEYKVLKLLIDKKNEIVKIEDFQSIWKKEMSKFTLRNHIKQIRDKTYPELIINSSNIGYKLIAN